uniref:Speckle-type POZ protein n=1 Tax=Strongyloides papillosus TaxID=174720 RepID=A0A0N5C1U0_STREA
MTSNESSSKSKDLLNYKKRIHEASIIWTIDKFSVCKEKTGQCKISPPFKSHTDDKLKLFVVLYPKGDEDINKDYISIYLNFECSYDLYLTFESKFFVINSEGKKKGVNIVENRRKYNHSLQMHGHSQFFERRSLFNRFSGLMANDTLIIGCEIFYSHNIIRTDGTLMDNNVNEPLNTLPNDFCSLLKSSNFSDCVIKVKDSEIYVHKCVLADRSEVFNSILIDKQNGYSPNIIEINDFSPKAVKEMVNYLYTGKLPKMDDITCEMLAIGDKYKLNLLKLAAEEKLMIDTEVDTVCDYLIKSELHSSEILQEWCLRFICMHAEFVVKSVAWKNIIVDYALLVAKFFNFFASMNN